MSQSTLECVNNDSAELATRMSPMQRRGFLAAGGAVIGGLAVVLGKAPAEATHGCLGQPHCCELATCTWCQYAVSRDRYNCAEHEGYHRTLWSCTEGGRLVWCGECSGDAGNCWVGPFACSIWFYN